MWLYLLYKLIDLLIRIPKRSSPTSVVNNILITGCDMGFGRQTALRLDRKGFNVFAACLTEKGKTDLEKASGTGRINAFLMDVRDTKSIEKAYEHVKKSLPKGVGEYSLPYAHLTNCKVTSYGLITNLILNGLYLVEAIVSIVPVLDASYCTHDSMLVVVWCDYLMDSTQFRAETEQATHR